MLRVYKTLIRPHLEYCVQLWNPAAEHGNGSLMLRIESVQRRFTRIIEEVGLLPYSERLQSLQLTTLAERHSRGDRIEFYKANKSFFQLAGVLNFSRSGSNLICKPGKSCVILLCDLVSVLFWTLFDMNLVCLVCTFVLSNV